jgi:hypothetical protein
MSRQIVPDQDHPFMNEREILKAYWNKKVRELSLGVDIPMEPVCDVCGRKLNFPERATIS